MTPDRHFTYPTNRLLAVIDDPAVARQAVRSLAAAGFPDADVTLFTPAEATPAPNAWTRLVRLFQFLSMDQGPDFHYYEAAVREGRAVVAVRLRGRGRQRRDDLERARDILVAAGGHFLNWFGRLQTEEITQWRGPEPQIPEYLRR